MSSDTEEKILEAAQSIFVEKGLSGARMQEIADEAGISKALLHYYYRTKDHMFEAVFRKCFGEMIGSLGTVFDEETTLFDAIRIFYDVHIEFLRRNPKLPLFLLSEVGKMPSLLSSVMSDYHLDVLQIIERKVDVAVKQNLIEPISTLELLINMVSLSVFQFMNFPTFKALAGPSAEISFDYFIEHRKKSLAEFVINAIKK